MIHQIFTFHDSKAQAYLPPFFLHQDGMALRTFSDLVAEKEHPFARHPEDYTLFKIGEFDDSTGKITVITPISLANGVELLKPVEPGDLFEAIQ